MQDRYFEQQCHSLIDKHHHQDHDLDIELQYMNGQRAEDKAQEEEEEIQLISTPPMSPSRFILPRCMQENQCYSPVQLVALPERKPKRIKFRAAETESLIEKFDKITIMETRKRRKSAPEMTTSDEEEDEDKENKRSDSWRVGEERESNRVLSEDVVKLHLFSLCGSIQVDEAPLLLLIMSYGVEFKRIIIKEQHHEGRKMNRNFSCQ